MYSSVLAWISMSLFRINGGLDGWGLTNYTSRKYILFSFVNSMRAASGVPTRGGVPTIANKHA